MRYQAALALILLVTGIGLVLSLTVSFHLMTRAVRRSTARLADAVVSAIQVLADRQVKHEKASSDHYAKMEELLAEMTEAISSLHAAIRKIQTYE